MRVFVLCTGRCGSTTFTYACKHMTNFTAGHETRAKFIGSERLEYPDDHIEIDNRLSWLLGRLESAYGDDAYYVHLQRDRREVAESYARRMSNPASIGAAYKTSILMDGPHEDLDVCLDVTETMVANIEHFLRDKTYVMEVSLENIEEDFARFWDWIGAEGDKAAALAEWGVLYNDSQHKRGAITHPQPDTKLRRLQVEHRKLEKELRDLQTKATETLGKFEYADRLYRDSAAKVVAAKQQRAELEKRMAKLEGELDETRRRWKGEVAELGSEMSDQERALKRLREEGRSLSEKLDTSELEATTRTHERDAFIKYADALQERYRRVLTSRTWKVLGPYRWAMRKVKGVLRGEHVPSNPMPTRPLLAPANLKRPKPTKSSVKRESGNLAPVRDLDGKLWSGFSRSAIREFEAIKGDASKPFKDRSEAAYSLARWHAFQRGDLERALADIQAMRILNPHAIADPRQFLAESLFLCRLGRAEEARSLLSNVDSEFNPSVQLMFANTWNPVVTGRRSAEAEAKVLEYLNTIYERFGLSFIEKRDPDRPLSIDNIKAATSGQQHSGSDAKVTVIMPVFNAEDTLITALTSVAEQTWHDLEVLVVDDASTDDTAEIVAAFSAQDSRFQLIRSKENLGTYVNRNRALEFATGAFVTVHDSDDWSHPDKITCQVQDLRERAGPYNLAMWVRTTSALAFFGNSREIHDLVRPDHSSGLFPRESLERFGAWDSVRVSADTELYWRMERQLGNKKWNMKNRLMLKNCPLAFGRMSDSSLTQAASTRVMTIFHGLRREYRDAADFWHSQLKNVQDPKPSARRTPLFPAPHGIRRDKDSTPPGLDVLLIADSNSAATPIQSVVQVLQTAIDDNVRIGLFHYPHFDSNVTKPLRHEVRRFAWDNNLRILAPGETVETGTVVVLTPRVFEHAMDLFPEVTHRRLLVVADVALPAKGTEAAVGYDSAGVRANLIEAFGSAGEWVVTDELPRIISEGPESLGLDAPVEARVVR